MSGMKGKFPLKLLKSGHPHPYVSAALQTTLPTIDNAEIVALFGAAATKHPGWFGILHDTTSGKTIVIVCDGTSYTYPTLNAPSTPYTPPAPDYEEADTSGAPSQAALASAFGAATAKGEGWIGCFKDIGTGGKLYIVATDGTDYHIQALTVGA